MTSKNSLLCATACLALFPAIATAQSSAAAGAQPGEGGGQASVVEEIIVTANRRAERLQDVPISVTAIAGETLQERGVQNPEDLSRLAPSLVTQNNAANAQGTNFSIRGVGTSSFQRSVEPSVAVVIDDITLIRSELAVINFTDLAQVEVLNGPQGFLFGKNASAGLVNIRTRDPELGDSGGRLFSEYGQLNNSNNTSLFRAQGIANLAIREDAAARFNLFYVKNSALQDNVVPNPAFDGGLEQIGGSGKLLWQPSDALRVLLSADYMDSQGTGGGVATLRNATAASPLSIVLPAIGVTPGVDNDRSAYNGLTFYDLKVGGGQARIDYEFDSGFRLTNIAAYRGFKTEQAFDADYSPLDLVQFFGGGISTRQFSEELRLASPVGGRLDYQVGVFVLQARVRESNLLAASLGQTPPPGFTTVLGSDSFWRQNLGSYAVYGQGTYRFTDRLSLTAGARVTHETIDMRFENTAGGGVAPLLPIAPDRSQDRKESNFSWRTTLQYDLNDDWMIYGTAAEGYKGPGYAQYSFSYVKPETSTHFEIGSKSQLLDRKLTVNVSAYNTDFKDFQAQSIDFTTLSFLLQNAGKLRTRGAEVQVIARPTSRLTLNAGVAYTDARFRDFQGDTCYVGQVDCVGGATDSSGRRLPNAPKWKGVFDASYEQPLGRDFAAIFNVGVVAQSSYNFLSNGDPDALQGGVTTIDLGVTLNQTAQNWSLRAFCRNCTDERYVATVQGHPFFGADHIQNLSVGGFRQIGVALDLSF
ncbi:MAG: TonB-dependent receptor [Phenylobacterium sp.]|uniref:TonB-dependent receptor n=1 Tax=Phenylobacterium sp. TaxID=1871053 RepID=UPI002733B65C|nr:TonB-dependent receptor [Phenylobacterium sp.]MDP3748642.1 TonB-dependent receptor [Phenylobacterium sp.]